MTIAEALRAHLARTGEKQSEFAHRLGITPQTVSQLVRGDIKTPSPDIRRKLAKALRLRHVDLLVMAGELAADEIDQRPSPLPPDSDRAALMEMVPELTEGRARALIALVEAFRREDEIARLSDPTASANGAQGRAALAGD